MGWGDLAKPMGSWKKYGIFFNMTSLSVSKRSQKEIVRQTLMWETEVVRLRASVGGKQATFLT